MADRRFSFTDFQVHNPVSPPPGDRLDGEYARADRAIADLTVRIAASLKPDGTLRSATVGKTQLNPGLFDTIVATAEARVTGLVDQALAASEQALASANSAHTLYIGATAQNALAQDASTKSTSEAQDAASSAAEAAQSALDAAASADQADDQANHAAGDAALAEDWGRVSVEWAEHMPDPIPPNILATMGVSGDHWSSRWWANQAATLFDENHVGPPGPTGASGPAGPAGPTGAPGPPGTGSVSGMISGQIPIAATATGITSSANLSGDITSAPTTLVTTLATVNANVGTWNNVTVNGKGLVTAGSNVAYLTQVPAYTGDVTSAAGGTVNTLATVNANLGTFNNITINAKGLATAGSNVAYLTTSGVSGMTAGQIPIAASPTGIASSIPTSTFLTPATAASTYAPIASPSFTGNAAVAGNLTAGAIVQTGTGVSTGAVGLELGGARTGAGDAVIDIHATASTDFELRISRLAGANGNAAIQNTGTGSFTINNPVGVDIQGATAASNAATGIVGEYIESNIPYATAVSVTSGTPSNLTSISLTAGDWDVYGNVFTKPPGATVLTSLVVGISTISASTPDPSRYNQWQGSLTTPSLGIDAPYRRVSIGTTTTVYLVMITTFSAGTLAMAGTLSARRAR